MKDGFRFLTVSGADDDNNPRDLLKIHGPVEWAVIFDEDRAGQPGYPTKQWRDRFSRAVKGTDTLRSAHLCGPDIFGRLVIADRELLAGLENYQRVLLGYGLKTMSGYMAIIKKNISMIPTQPEIITVWDGKGTGALNDYFAVAAGHIGHRHSVLYDPSRGTGNRPTQWPQVPDEISSDTAICMAGGITPDTLAIDIADIAGKTGGRLFSVEMHSGVRTKGYLDLGKIVTSVNILQEMGYTR